MTRVSRSCGGSWPPSVRPPLPWCPVRWQEPFGLTALEAMASGVGADRQSRRGGLAELTEGVSVAIDPDDPARHGGRDRGLGGRPARQGEALAEAGPRAGSCGYDVPARTPEAGSIEDGTADPVMPLNLIIERHRARRHASGDACPAERAGFGGRAVLRDGPAVPDRLRAHAAVAGGCVRAGCRSRAPGGSGRWCAPCRCRHPSTAAGRLWYRRSSWSATSSLRRRLEHWLLRDPRSAHLAAAGSCRPWRAYIGIQCLYQYATGRDFFGFPRWADGELTGPFYKPRAGPELVRILFPALLAAL